MLAGGVGLMLDGLVRLVREFYAAREKEKREESAPEINTYGRAA